jgi:hypothetical protein
MVSGKAFYEAVDLCLVQYLVEAGVASRSGIQILCTSNNVVYASRFRTAVRVSLSRRMWAAVAQPVTQPLVLFQHGPKDWMPAVLVRLQSAACVRERERRGSKRATLQQMLESKCRHGWDSARMHDMQFTHVRTRVSICAHQWHVRVRYNSHAVCVPLL